MSQRPSMSASTSRTVIFVRHNTCASLQRPGLEIRPPATRGDLIALLAETEATRESQSLKVGIIDGTTNGPSLPPKEVMSALNAGAQMYGAVGDGALRAAECAPYGMTGVGQIYEQAVTQFVSRLDDYWTPASSGPADQSLAAWHVALRHGIKQGEVDQRDAGAFLDVARKIPWFRRTLGEISPTAPSLESGKVVGRVTTFLVESGRNIMLKDCQAMIEAMLGDD